MVYHHFPFGSGCSPCCFLTLKMCYVFRVQNRLNSYRRIHPGSRVFEGFPHNEGHHGIGACLLDKDMVHIPIIGLLTLSDSYRKLPAWIAVSFQGAIMTQPRIGILTDARIQQAIYPALHRGVLGQVKAVVVHQTDSDTAQQVFNKYAGSRPTGAHLLIDKAGVIYQTARLDQKCAHIGKIVSRCYETRACSKAEYEAAYAIYHEKGLGFGARVANLYRHEKAKRYPSRYPMNEDAIGIELVGKARKVPGSKEKVYESVNTAQNASLAWLVDYLYLTFWLTDADVYRHPVVSRKNSSEAASAQW